ncbi:MAG: DUF4392 domain-containing protein [Firmicutes bacterium]|nr:DUF4392 domain-containing protein [Bacillota bacterium]
MAKKPKFDAEFEAELLKIMRHDMGRGLLDDIPDVDLEEIAEDLTYAKRVLILTGFPVRCPDGFHGETDGPSGATNLAAALNRCGVEVWIVTDGPSYPLLKAATAFMAPKTTVLCVEGRQSAALAAEWVDRIQPTHVISLERPGMAEDGHYHNVRGLIIDDMVTDTEPFYQEARHHGAHTIAIGDGGNELGMGAYRKQVIANVPSGELVCAYQKADWTLASGISNWWGWGIAAMLSVKKGTMLLPTLEQEEELLRVVVEAGGVDGVTARPEMTVDNMCLEEYLSILEEVRQATIRELKESHWRMK